MATHISTLACILAAALVCVYADRPEKLVRGTDAPNHAYPYMVSFRFKNTHFCGGAIINSEFIITAAHCLEPLKTIPAAFVTVVTGTNYLDRGGEIHRIAGYVQHPKYDHESTTAEWNYDLGIVKLSQPISFNAFQKPIPLPTKAPNFNKPAVVSAWGATGRPSDATSNNLQELHLPLLTTEKCRYTLPHPITDLLICTYKDRGVGTCSGDSGSPLTQDGYIIGVVSGGIPCATGRPDVFTNIHTLIKFVKESLEL